MKMVDELLTRLFNKILESVKMLKECRCEMVPIFKTNDDVQS